MAMIVEVGALLVAVFIVYLIYSFLKNPAHVIANSVIGIILFVLVNLFLVRDIAINIFSVGIVAISGVAGVILILLLHFLGLGF